MEYPLRDVHSLLGWGSSADRLHDLYTFLHYRSHDAQTMTLADQEYVPNVSTRAERSDAVRYVPAKI